MYTEQITQAMAIGPAVNPQVINNASKLAGGVDMSLSRRAIFILEIGAVTGGGAITAQLVEDTQASRPPPPTWPAVTPASPASTPPTSSTPLRPAPAR
jgi:hypothetical protein